MGNQQTIWRKMPEETAERKIKIFDSEKVDWGFEGAGRGQQFITLFDFSFFFPEGCSVLSFFFFL